ncbi:MAG: hypothetical protein CHACPFDD_00978 [Phycisphaerae bacterium]|nr:hypothetical protein [Phycisphaerae bacterium]
MSESRPRRTLREVLAGRWQIPLALASAGAVGVALLSLRPTIPPVNFDAAMADIAELMSHGAFGPATDAAANLLEHDPPVSEAQQAALHRFLADAIYELESKQPVPNPANLRLMLRHADEAARLRHEQPPELAVRSAEALEWLGEREAALERYRRLIEAAPESNEAHRSHQALVRLLEGHPQGESERRRSMAALLDDERTPMSFVWWALQRAVQDALDQNDTLTARELLERYGPRLARSDRQGYYAFLDAWIKLREGRPDEAGPIAEWVDDWLGELRPDPDRLSERGYLPAMNRWLRGEINLADERPQEALAAFDAALALQPESDLALAAMVGRGRAQARLGRDQDAAEELRAMVTAILAAQARDRADTAAHEGWRWRSVSPRALARLQQALETLAERARAGARPDDAVGYLSLAAELASLHGRRPALEALSNLAGLLKAAVDARPQLSSRELRGLARQTARTFEQAAALVELDERRVSDLLWSAAEYYDRAGAVAETRRILLRFADAHRSDPRYPAALLKLGQLSQVEGHFDDAVRQYETLWKQFPDVPESVRARVQLAECLTALGNGHEQRAEQILVDLLEDDRIAPESAAFLDALRALCDQLYYRGRYADAIVRLENLLTYAPDRPDRRRTMFMLADSFRQSGEALRASPPADTDAVRVDEVVRARLSQAAETFGEIYADESSAAEDEEGALYDRLAMQYRADCLLALGDDAALEQALVVLRQIAVRFDREPAALNAQVQIANIYLRRGMLTEAARAVERARWLLGNVPDEAFRAYDDGTDRSYWQRYINAISSSHLFKDVFATS